MRFIALLVAAVTVVAALAPSAFARVIETEHIRAEIVVRNAVTAPGDATDIAISHTLAPGWHTYWVNPGDSGEAPIPTWTLPAGADAADLRFPAPERLPYPPLMNFGFEDQFALMGRITIPEDWPAGRPFPVTLRMDWLVCSDICIPEGGETSFEIATGPVTEPDSLVAFTFLRAEQALPQTSDAEATYSRGGDTLYLSIPTAGMGLTGDEELAFFPEGRRIIDHAADQDVIEAADGNGITLTMLAGNGRLNGEMRGLLVSGGEGWWITATGDADPEPATASPSLTAASTTPTLTAALPTPPQLGLGQAMLFAFIGGLILNLMPCVFPVLALKALGLVAHANAGAGRRVALAGAYAGGILVSFTAVAAVLLGLKAAGVAVGWGFQLQSPAFVAAMAMLLFLIGLNLSGVFEVGLRAARAGDGAPTQGLSGSFATGVLATVVATPCTAPFMAVAVGTALATSGATAFAIFIALGLGLAAPFVVLTVTPGLARLLPKPGVWMERLKQALAFPLYATVAWLIWVLAQLTGTVALLPALIALVLGGLAAWLYGLSQRGEGRSHKVAASLAAVSLVAAVVAFWPAVSREPPAAAMAADPRNASYSPERLSALQAAGQPVFLNVTAAWCITCKVNEQVIFASDAFDELLATTGTTMLTADWTRRDPMISRLLEGFGRAGVPLYVHYDANGNASVLPQILTPAVLEDAFQS